MGAGQKFVPNGVMLMCNGGVAPGRLNVLPKNVMLGGQIFATELDTMPFVNIPSFGACQRLRYCPPCMPAPTGWKNVCEDGVKVMGARPLLEKSTNSCAIGGKITIMFVPPAAFRGSFTSITSSGLPDMSALSGLGSVAPMAANPMAALTNVGGIASLAGGSLPQLQQLGAMSSGLKNHLASAAESLKSSSGLTGVMGQISGAMGKVTNRFGQMMGDLKQATIAIQGKVQQGNELLGKWKDAVGSIGQMGGVIAHVTGNKRLQEVTQNLVNRIGNVQSRLNNVASPVDKYGQAAQKATEYFGKSSNFLNNFQKSIEKGALGKKWEAFTNKLDTRAQQCFKNFKQGISDLKTVKYSDTVSEWLKASKTGLEGLSGHAGELSKTFTNAQSYLGKSAERIKTFGGVVSTLTGNPNAQAALNTWTAKWDNAANKMGNYATKAKDYGEDFKNGAESAQTGAEWATKASNFFSKEAKTGDLKKKWDAFTEQLGNQASAFFDKIKTNAVNLNNIPYPNTAAGWLAAGGEGFTRFSGHLQKATNGLNDLKSDLAISTAKIRSFGGTLTRVTGNPRLTQWADKWDNATNKVGNAVNQGNQYAKDTKNYGDKLKNGAEFVRKAGDFFEKYKDKTPVGNPFQNWGGSISSGIEKLNKPGSIPSQVGSVKELLGDLSKVSERLNGHFTNAGTFLGKSVQGLNEFSGILSLVNKDSAAKIKQWANQAGVLQQQAKAWAEKANAAKEKIAKTQKDVAAGLQKAKDFLDKMKAKLPDFSKGADILSQKFPKLPNVAAVSSVFPAMNSIVAANAVVNAPAIRAISAPINMSPMNFTSNNPITNKSATTFTQTSAVKGGSVSVSASVGDGMGVENGNSRTGTVNVQKVSISLPDMSDKNPNEPKKQDKKGEGTKKIAPKITNSEQNAARKQAIDAANKKNIADRKAKLAEKKVQQQIDNPLDRKKWELAKSYDKLKKTGEDNIDVSAIQCIIPGKLGKLVPINVCFESKGTELKVSIPIDVGKVFSATPALNFKNEGGKPIVVGELELCASNQKIQKVISMVSKTSEAKGSICVNGNTQGEFKLAANADAESVKFDTSIQIKIQNGKITEVESSISGEYKGGYWAGGKVEGKYKQEVDIDITSFIGNSNNSK